MLDDGGGLFWVLTALVGAILLGGALALSLVREQETPEEERRASDEGGRRRVYEEARERS